MASKPEALGISPARLPSMTGAIAALPRWWILLFAAVCVRALTFGNPVVDVDEQFYFVTAQRMLEGALPYVDIWDRKPIGLFLLYAPAAALGTPWGILGYQMMALASVVLTAMGIARLAERAGWERGALVAALLYIFVINFADGQGGQAPVFYNLATITAMGLALPRAGDTRGDHRRIGRGMLAMLLIGIALQIKYSVVFEGLFLGLWLMWREWRLGASLAHVAKRGAGYAGMAMLPTLIAGGAYYAIGHGDAWAYANFGSIFERRSDPPLVLLVAFLKLALMLTPLLIVSALSRRMPVDDAAERPVRALYFGWLIAAVVGLIAFGTWFSHYALPVMLPASLCCAGFLGGHPTGRRIIAPLLLIVAALGGEFTVWSAYRHRGDAEELETLARAIGHGPGCLYMHSGVSIPYSYTDRCALSPWVYPSHLSRERENGAVGVDQLAEVRRIFTRRPAIVAMRPAYSGERLAVRTLVMRLLRLGGYALKGRYPLGDTTIAVYAAPVRAVAAPAPRLAVKRPS